MQSQSIQAGIARRARIIVLASEGESNTRIAALVGVSRQTVISWRARYERLGMEALADEARSGRPRTIDHRKIIAATLLPPPEKLGVTHWSTRLLANRLKISNSTVADAWREYGVQPRRAGAFRFSTDPELIAKAIDIVGLHLQPRENAIVLCVDERSQNSALELRAPILPTQIGSSERQTQNAIRPGTPTLFAALEIETVKVAGICRARHGRQELLAFLKHVARTYPDQELHLVLDNCAIQNKHDVQNWLMANPRIHTHVTPTSESWMKLVEVWFAIIERQVIHRDDFSGAKEFAAELRGLHQRLGPAGTTLRLDENCTTDLAKVEGRKLLKRRTSTKGLVLKD